MKRYNIYITLGVAAFAVIMFFFLRRVTSPEYHNQQQADLSFKTIVKEKYIDHDNHGAGVFKFENGMIYVTPTADIYFYVNPGDSLVKNKDSLLLKAVRKDSVFYFDLKSQFNPYP